MGQAEPSQQQGAPLAFGSDQIGHVMIIWNPANKTAIPRP
jgi:hypothetical protein